MKTIKFKKIQLFFIMFVLLNSQYLFAQSNPDLDKQIEEVMKAREEMLRSLMDDSFSSDFEKRMQEMMKRFGSGNLDFGFDHLEQFGMGDSEWSESSTHRLLALKIHQIKDRPLDIKIEKGMIRIKGDTEVVSGPKNRQSKSIMKFERQYSIPQDVDQNNPEFENKNNEMVIKFKKKEISKVKSKGKTESIKENEKKPIKPTDDSLSI
jgi:HSP20 family molecular chaperone IbpA